MGWSVVDLGKSESKRNLRTAQDDKEYLNKIGQSEWRIEKEVAALEPNRGRIKKP